MEKEYIAGEPQRYEIGNRVFIVEPRYDKNGESMSDILLARAAFFTMGHGWEPSASPLIKKGCALPSTMLSQKAPPILPTFCGSWRSPGMRSSMGAAV